jgi:poly(3-hydroxybutyrate) depolymerase
LDEIGYIYYPFKCIDGNISCKVHVFFHGCGKQVNFIDNSGLDYITQLGFLEYAAANNLIVVFP